jgi:hypothetical protein
VRVLVVGRIVSPPRSRPVRTRGFASRTCEAVGFATLFAPLVLLALMFALERVERWLAASDSIAQPGRVVQLVNPPRYGALPGEHSPVDVPSRRVA